MKPFSNNRFEPQSKILFVLKTYQPVHSCFVEQYELTVEMNKGLKVLFFSFFQKKGSERDKCKELITLRIEFCEALLHRFETNGLTVSGRSDGNL